MFELTFGKFSINLYDQSVWPLRGGGGAISETLVGGIYNYLTIQNKYVNLSFLVKVLVQKFVLGNSYGKITIRILEDKLVRFLVQESQSQSSSHDFLLFDTQSLPCISTLSS